LSPSYRQLITAQMTALCPRPDCRPSRTSSFPIWQVRRAIQTTADLARRLETSRLPCRVERRLVGARRPDGLQPREEVSSGEIRWHGIDLMLHGVRTVTRHVEIALVVVAPQSLGIPDTEPVNRAAPDATEPRAQAGAERPRLETTRHGSWARRVPLRALETARHNGRHGPAPAVPATGVMAVVLGRIPAVGSPTGPFVGVTAAMRPRRATPPEHLEARQRIAPQGAPAASVPLRFGRPDRLGGTIRLPTRSRFPVGAASRSLWIVQIELPATARRIGRLSGGTCLVAEPVVADACLVERLV